MARLMRFAIIASSTLILPSMRYARPRQQPQSRRGRRRTRRQGAAARAHGDCLGRRQRRPLPGVGRGQFHNRRGAARRWRLACARRLNRCCTMDGKISVEEAIMANRINRAIELLAGDQAIYYVGGHSGHVLTSSQGREDADTWADYINIGMEHGSFDMAGLAEYMQGLIEGGPTRSGHRTPTVIVEAPVNGTDAANVRFNAWQFRQILGRGVHGVLLCQAESADAVRAFVESCRYPHQSTGIDPTLPSVVERMHGAIAEASGDRLGIGTRGRGSEATAAPIWGISPEEYMQRCDPWPLNPNGELLLGVKLESPEGIANCEEI